MPLPHVYFRLINQPCKDPDWPNSVTSAVETTVGYSTQEGYDSLMKNGGSTLIELPPGKNLITCKWVVKDQDSANGNIVRFKA